MTVPFHPGPRNNRPSGPPQQIQVQVAEADFCPCPACLEDGTTSLHFNQVFKVAIIPTPVLGEKQMGLTPLMQCVECGECFPLGPKGPQLPNGFLSLRQIDETAKAEAKEVN